MIFYLASGTILLTLLWVIYLSDISMIKHHIKMEKLDITHIRTMGNLFKQRGSSVTDLYFQITYIVPTKKQPLWVQLLDRIRIHPYIYEYKIDTIIQRTSRYTKIISKNKWFYLQLKNWSETTDHEAGRDAMKYLCWKKDIP